MSGLTGTMKDTTAFMDLFLDPDLGNKMAELEDLSDSEWYRLTDIILNNEKVT